MPLCVPMRATLRVFVYLTKHDEDHIITSASTRTGAKDRDESCICIENVGNGRAERRARGMAGPQELRVKEAAGRGRRTTASTPSKRRCATTMVSHEQQNTNS